MNSLDNTRFIRNSKVNIIGKKQGTFLCYKTTKNNAKC